jgi:diguanylate cyclase (GGDEF)-like protein
MFRLRLDPRDRVPAAVLLGLAEDERAPLADAGAMRLAQVRTVWPIAMAAQVVGSAVLIVMPTQAGTPNALAFAGVGAVTALAGLIWALLALPLTRHWPVHRLNRALTGLAAAIAAGLLMLLWAAARMPSGSAQLGSFVAAAGAIGITAVALQPVRAATLGFGAGLVLALFALAGPGMALAVAAAFYGCLGASARRLARYDVDAAIRQAAEQSEHRLAAKMIAEFEGQGTGWFWEADRYGRLTYLSATVATELKRAGSVQPVGRMLTDVFQMDGATPGTERTLAFHLSSRTSFHDYPVCAAGAVSADRWWSISGRPLLDDDGRFAGFIGSGSDLTERRRSEAEITRLAMFDGLTGLANRQHMRVSLDKTLAQSPGAFRPVALFLLDLDRFKAVNDTLGHQAGDALLKQVAQRLQRGVGDAGLVGRLGGDEFQMLLPGMDNREALAILARDLIKSISQPYFISGASISIGGSIGIALALKPGDDAETLIRNADLALYAAKGDGRGVHRFYSPEMLAGAQTRQLLEEDLRHAIATGAFHLTYQPVVATADTRIVGYEALVRWDHPTRGAVSPAEFIPVAEDCGLIGAIGEWVLRTACLEAARWPGDIRVAVNVSPIQFADPQLPALVTSALARSGLAPARLELEITEGVFLDEKQSSDAMFRSLKGLGVRLALDDFGTGYSSLGYLRTAPFDKIKIDQSFVKGAAQPGNRNAAIIKAIVTLAETLDMETTAEGVEVEDEIELVRRLGCSHIQGFIYGKPARAEEVARQLAAGGGTVAADGFRVSRSPRNTMLRSARVAIGGTEGDVRIRNISSTGAMIDGLEIDGNIENGGAGLDVLIELLEDQMFAARIRWARDGRAGIEFAEAFNLERLNQSGARIRRLAG